MIGQTCTSLFKLNSCYNFTISVAIGRYKCRLHSASCFVDGESSTPVGDVCCIANCPYTPNLGSLLQPHVLEEEHVVH